MSAIAKIDVLADVVEFKQTFYPSSWANLETAVPGTLKLLPSATHLDALRKDYRNMGAMIFDDPIPSFDEILEGIGQLEAEINAI